MNNTRRLGASWPLLAGLLGAGCSFATGEFSLAPGDAGADLGTVDNGGPVDTGKTDLGTVDNGGPIDVPAVDVGSSDVTAADVVDAGAGDAGFDAGAPDTGPEDAGPADTGEGGVTFCGAARPCPTGEVCNDGLCADACLDGQMACGGLCRDVQADNANCGGCGVACAGGSACVDGACACPSGQTLCGGVCTNLQTDPTHCGACATACAAGQLCGAGACVTTCSSGLTNCSGTCRDLQGDVASCGTCGHACAAPTGGTASCSAGVCAAACPRGRANCNGACVDLDTSATNCGACGMRCNLLATTCSGGMCCGRGLTGCGGTCVSLQTSGANCGACGRVCAAGTTCRAGNCEYNFRVNALTANNCREVDYTDATSPVGDDRGGLAANASFVYFNGDTGAGRALAPDLSSFANLTSPAPLDGLVSNLRSGTIYALSLDGATSYRYGTSTGAAFTTLLELNQTTLAPTTTRITLTPPIPFDAAVAGTQSYGVFAGYDRVVVYNNSHAFNVALPSGAVTDLGAVTLPNPVHCETWAYWGVAEFFQGSVWLAYRQAATSATASNVVRVRVPDGTTQTLGAFTNLGDMCSFTVAPGRLRWYFHQEGPSQFAAVAGGAEVFGFCDASFLFTN